MSAVGSGVTSVLVRNKNQEAPARAKVVIQPQIANPTIVQSPPTRITRTSPNPGEGDVALTRETIIEFSQPVGPSVVYPTAVYAQAAGQLLPVNRFVSHDKKRITLVTPENKEVVVAAADVAARRTGPSAMPADLHTKMSRRELRDVVEFLTSLKDPPKK